MAYPMARISMTLSLKATFVVMSEKNVLHGPLAFAELLA